jgi:hypothetical protein
MTGGGGALLAVATLLALTGQARAGPQACARAYESAQERRVEGRLRAAHEQLLACAQASCPAFIRSDCAQWLAEVETAQPSVVFTAPQAVRDLELVTVTCDGERLASGLDGRAIAMDPGKHTCRFDSPGVRPTSVSLLVSEGQKSRVVEIALDGAAAPGQAAARPRPGLAVPLVLSGVAALGLVGFAAFGGSGLAAEQRLGQRCAPACDAGAVNAVRRSYHLADISLGAGMVAATAAGYLLWKGRESPRPGGASVAVGLPAGGAAVMVRSPF